MHAGKIVWQGKPEAALVSDDPYIHQFAHATKDGPMLNH
jgi:ABC-type transporter Mla maintaining outer membrane lipid asymmetry ATPase subunit MlaF